MQNFSLLPQRCFSVCFCLSSTGGCSLPAPPPRATRVCVCGRTARVPVPPAAKRCAPRTLAPLHHGPQNTGAYILVAALVALRAASLTPVSPPAPPPTPTPLATASKTYNEICHLCDRGGALRRGGCVRGRRGRGKKQEKKRKGLPQGGVCVCVFCAVLFLRGARAAGAHRPHVPYVALSRLRTSASADGAHTGRATLK